MQYEVEAAPAGGYAKRLAAGLSALDGLVRKSPDAAARIVIVAVALVLFWLTWAHWGDIQVDCGRELYVPVQILHGKLLYRDLWYPYGPLGPYLSAVLVDLFGQHLDVFYLFGLTLATACALLSFDIGAMLAGRAVGLTVALTGLFQGFQSSIFNYIFPYAYAATLGLLLALLCMLFVLRRTLYGNGRNLMFAGLAAGLALITKQEQGIACYILLAFSLLMEAALQRSARTLLHGIAWCAPGVGIAVAVYGWFSWKLTLDFILLDNWNFTPGSYFMRTHGARYAAQVGLRFIPVELILLILDATGAMLLWLWIAKIGAAHFERAWWRSAAIILLASAVLAARQFAPLAMYIILALLTFPPGMFFIGCAFLACTLYKLRGDSGNRRLLAKTAFGVFALLLSVRILARVVPSGYSIFYDVPLILTFIIAVAARADAVLLEPAAGRRRKLVNSLLAIELVMLAFTIVPGKSERTARLETGWGAIYLRPAEAAVARQIIDLVLEQKAQGRRVVLLPELPMLYALTGTTAPSRWYTITPGFLAPRQEDDYIAELGRAAPNYIVLTNRYTKEYGEVYFGIDYDQKILQWIDRNYRVTGEFGNFRRDGSRGLAALLYERRGSNLSAGHGFGAANAVGVSRDGFTAHAGWQAYLR
jgi:4-amino-4-deoxy-L-arabinose transferase-like glycosyltransferase